MNTFGPKIFIHGLKIAISAFLKNCQNGIQIWFWKLWEVLLFVLKTIEDPVCNYIFPHFVYYSPAGTIKDSSSIVHEEEVEVNSVKSKTASIQEPTSVTGYLFSEDFFVWLFFWCINISSDKGSFFSKSMLRLSYLQKMPDYST